MKTRHLLLTIALCTAPLLRAAVLLGPACTDNAVLQRDMPLPIRGTAEPGETVTVTFAGQQKQAIADADGQWQVVLDPLPASSENRTLTATAPSGQTESHNVLVGEVWLCSGQSNMECPLWGGNPRYRHYTDTETGLDAAQQAADDQLRFVMVPRTCSTVATDELAGRPAWQAATVESVQPFSAVGYFFGRQLREKLQIPIGLIGSYWGGSTIEAFTAPEGFDAVPELKSIAESVNAKLPGHPDWEKARDELTVSYLEYLVSVKKAGIEKRPMPVAPAFPAKLVPFDNHQQPAMKYNSMIWPFRGTAIRGAIWYQGESNLYQREGYTPRMAALHQGWKAVFDNPHLKLYYVQIAPFNYGGGNIHMPFFWEAQEKYALDNPVDAGMVVVNDIGNLGDIHPGDKRSVGNRLANLALRRDYGFSDLPAEMPILKSFREDGNAMRLSFNFAAGWHTLDGGPVRHFQLAGRDGIFHEATAEIDGADILVSCADVAKPYAVRYMFDNLAEASLIADTGLPLGAFRCGNENPWEDTLADYEQTWKIVFKTDLRQGVKNNAMPYEIDNSAAIGDFSRVAYAVIAKDAAGQTRYLFLEADAFTKEAARLGVPALATGTVFQQRIGKTRILTNAGGLANGEITDTAIEFWGHNYAATIKMGYAGGDNGKYDFDDTRVENGSYGSMQFHDLAGNKTLFSYSNFTVGANADLGFGNATDGNPDWTFSKAMQNYTSVILYVFVK